MISLFKRVFCKHTWLFIRNIYGDEIIEYEYKRSVYKCRDCGKYKHMDELGHG